MGAQIRRNRIKSAGPGYIYIEEFQILRSSKGWDVFLAIETRAKSISKPYGYQNYIDVMTHDLRHPEEAGVGISEMD